MARMACRPRAAFRPLPRAAASSMPAALRRGGRRAAGATRAGHHSPQGPETAAARAASSPLALTTNSDGAASSSIKSCRIPAAPRSRLSGRTQILASASANPSRSSAQSPAPVVRSARSCGPATATSQRPSQWLPPIEPGSASRGSAASTPLHSRRSYSDRARSPEPGLDLRRVNAVRMLRRLDPGRPRRRAPVRRR